MIKRNAREEKKRKEEMRLLETIKKVHRIENLFRKVKHSKLRPVESRTKRKIEELKLIIPLSSSLSDEDVFAEDSDYVEDYEFESRDRYEGYDKFDIIDSFEDDQEFEFRAYENDDF